MNSNKKNIFGNILFITLMCIMALRLSFSENPLITSFNIKGMFLDNLISIIISCLLIILFLIWLGVYVKKNGLQFGMVEAGVAVFIAAAVISSFFASNKRDAITASATILSSMLTAVMLARLLNSAAKRKIVLLVIIAAAAANVYQCIEQYASSNKLMVEQYQAEPNTQLEKLGIEPGSFEHMLYEHRLYSKDVKGFFTTSNSAATFLNMAMFAIFALFDFKNKNAKQLIIPVIFIAVMLSGMAMAYSKGAIAAMTAAGICLLGTLKFGRLLQKYRIAVVLVLILAATGIMTAVINYGVKNGRLPGGNSMLVRWQYWQGAGEMLKDNWQKGIGGGNFGTNYTQYKLPQAIETVKDPHCFILSIACQYGILGICGFILAAAVPVIKNIYAKKQIDENALSQQNDNFYGLAKNCITTIVLAMLFIRPILTRTPIGNQFEVAVYILAITYIAPAFMAAVAFWVVIKAKIPNLDKSDVNIAAVVCAIIAVVLHNMIDFAIFEPGIMTALWALIAIVYSKNLPKKKNAAPKTNAKKTTKITAAAIIAAVAAIMVFIITPAVKTNTKMEKAGWLVAAGELQEAVRLLQDAGEDDRLSPNSSQLAAKVLMYNSGIDIPNTKLLLKKTETFIKTAIQRDIQNYQNYANLAQVYKTLGEVQPEKKNELFEDSFDMFKKAVEKYPGNGRLRLQMADMAVQTNRKIIALENYRKAVEIEDAYEKQFKIMYPKKQQIFSRLGKINYINAKEQIKKLKNED